MIARKLGISVLIPAALLALIALFSITQTASAQPGEPSMSGGFTGEALPTADEPGLEAGMMEDRVLPGPARGADANDEPRADEKPEDKGSQNGAPQDKTLDLTVPKLGMKDVPVGSSPDQSYLDREGIMRLSGTGFPWQEEANTYIAGHAIGYPGSRVPEAFRNLEDLQKGDRITLRDSRGETYEYRVYERMIVSPSDFWVTSPVKDKDIVSLQTCWPEPTFEQRLIVRAERV